MKEALKIASENYKALKKKEPVEIRFIDNRYKVNPEGNFSNPSGGEVPDKHKILILHYLLSDRSGQKTGELIDFKSLPGGISYNPVFEGRVYSRLNGLFGENHKLFLLSGEKIGGVKTDFGDAGMKFEILPEVFVYIILFAGNDEFKPACKILFDSDIKQYFPTEDSIIICEELAGKLAQASREG